MRRRHTLIAPLIVASLALVGCSSDGSDGAAKEDPITTAAPDSGGTTATTAAGGGGGGATVDIAEFAFDPDGLDVQVGDTVTFTNDDSATHNATADDGAPEAFETGDISEGDSAEVTFGTAGDYEYYCSIHEYMTGTITVEG